MRMYSSLRFGLLVPALLCVSSLAYGGIMNLVLPRHGLQTITVTDMTAEGRLQRQPTPQQPIYFVAVSAGFREMGAAIPGERPISRDLVNQTVLGVLAKQGFLPARPGQVPDIVIAWQWGTMNVEVFRGGAAAGGMRIALNQHQLIQFMGGYKAGTATPSFVASPYGEYSYIRSIGGVADQIAALADDHLYVVQLIACAPTMRDGKLVRLWNTRISCNARGFWMTDALPTAITMAGPMIGRETPTPVALAAEDVFRAKVELGELKSLGQEVNVSNFGESD